MDENVNRVVILCGDVPLLTPGTVNGLVAEHERKGNDITVLAVELEDPAGYGRIVADENRRIMKIVEEADATPAEKDIKIINSGIYCVQKNYLKKALDQIGMDNAQKEMYLTDIVAIGRREGRKVGVMVGTDKDEVVGINSLEDLKEAEGIMLRRMG